MLSGVNQFKKTVLSFAYVNETEKNVIETL